MRRSSVPYLFLAVLFAVLLFIIGVRYGQRVEQANKAISLLISLAPTATTAPTTPPLAFREYVHPGCRIMFLVPNDLKKTDEGSASAVFSTRSETLAVAVSCERKTLLKSDTERSVNLTKTIRAYETATRDTSAYRFVQPVTGKVITITVAKPYLPLIQTSLSMSP